MSFELHPILEAGDAPQSGVWYALSPTDTSGPGPRVGGCAITLTARKCVVVLSGGATPEGSLSDLYLLDTRKGYWKSNYSASSFLLRTNLKNATLRVGNTPF